MINTALIEGFKKYGIERSMWGMLLGFAVAEGNNPAGNPTLGFVDYQLPGIGTDLDSHVKALADQLEYRLPVAGPFPASGSDYEQAKWMAVVVGQVGSPSDWQGNAQPSQEHYIRSIVNNMPSQAEMAQYSGRPVIEKVLPYDRAIVPQETGYWCGPAATQIVLNSRGIIRAESDLARRIGTHTGGTDYVGLIEKVLDQELPDALYTSVYLERDPATPAQKEALWDNLKNSIDAGYGVVMNWVAPPNNYPRGVNGSTSPRYGGGTVFHYVACMGYRDDNGTRSVWIADSGFQPQGYWISFDQCAKLIPPKGYCVAAVPAPTPEAPKPPKDEWTKFKEWMSTQTDRQLIEWLCEQMGPGHPDWPSKGNTLRNKVFGV